MTGNMSSRTEECEIAFEDIKRGDRIRTLTYRTQRMVDSMLQREGFVDEIIPEYRQLSTSRDGRLTDGVRDNTEFILVTAVENDPVWQKLDALPYNSVVTFKHPDEENITVAVKYADRWEENQCYIRESIYQAGDTFTVLS